MAKQFKICQADLCINTNRNSKLTFFAFPTNNPNRMQMWLNNVCMKQPAKKLQYLCSEHFEEAAFTNSFRRRLLPESVPTFQVPGLIKEGAYSCLPEISIEKGPVSVETLHDSSTTPEKKNDAVFMASSSMTKKNQSSSPYKMTPKSRKLNRYKSVIYRLKKRLFFKNSSSSSSNATALNTMKEKLLPSLYNIVVAQLRNSGPARGRRWTSYDKTFAFNIYISSPSAYRVLRRFVILPSVRTLRRSVQGICQTAGFCPEILQVLKQKVQLLGENQRECILSFDEMSIRPSLHYSPTMDVIMGYQDELSVRDFQNIKVANNTLVFMVRGLHSNWKQVLGHFLVHRSMPGPALKELVVSCIVKLQDIGLNVVSLVCDQGANNISLFSLLGLTVDQTFFQVKNQNVFFIFDPPHLLKSLRNNLLKYKLMYERPGFGTVAASWKYIYDFYEIDKGNEPRVIPKITKNHVNPMGRSKMKVKFASQTLSRSVAAGINLLKSVGRFDAESAHTVNFILNIDKLFDSFNSSTTNDKKELLCSVKKDSVHLDFWKEMLSFVQSWNFVNVNSRAVHTHCKKGWLITLNSSIGLSQYLLQIHDDVFMRRFNQDALENTFSVVRSKRGHDTNPDCFQLKSCLRAVMVNNIFKRSKVTNCEVDFDQALISLNDRTSKYSNISSVFSDHIEMNSPLPDISCLSSDIVTENVIYYIAGYVGKEAVMKLDNCAECGSSLFMGGTVVSNNKSLLTDYKDYSGNLKRPSNSLFNIVQKIYNVDTAHIFWSKNVLQNMLFLYKDVINFNCLNIHEIHKERVHKFISTLVSKIRIYSHIKKVNNELKTEFYTKSVKKLGACNL